ncbi:hypothetical protein [Klebsiella pneumoniae IS10]|nr:hypothetical protein [Klebsiella pneumoniae IS10]
MVQWISCSSPFEGEGQGHYLTNCLVISSSWRTSAGRVLPLALSIIEL